MSGWVKLHREIFDSDIWSDVTTFRLFLLLIGKASHQDSIKHKGMTLNKGQYIRSYRKLADDLSYKEGRGMKKYSLNTISKSVKKLVEDERITVQENELGTLFTIVNYEKYQTDNEHFNALNGVGSENVKRTEQRTAVNNEELNVDAGYKPSTEGTVNAINNEQRTNGELMENEVRTRSRIKELKNYKDDDDNACVRADNNIFTFYEQEGFGTISSFTAERLSDLADTYNEQVVLSAMKEAVLHGARNLKYVEAILKNPNSKKRGGNNGKSIQQHGRSFDAPERKDSITGGKVGWINRRRETV